MSVSPQNNPPLNFTKAKMYANLNGNASTAAALATARTISLNGAVTGSGSFDGSANLTIATTLANGGATYFGTAEKGGILFSGSNVKIQWIKVSFSAKAINTTWGNIYIFNNTTSNYLSMGNWHTAFTNAPACSYDITASNGDMWLGHDSQGSVTSSSAGRVTVHRGVASSNANFTVTAIGIGV